MRNTHKNIRQYLEFNPKIESSAYVDESAIIIGQVTIGKNSSLWCNSVARGDVSYIKIGDNTNIQDLSMLHVTHYNKGKTDETPLIIGNNVTVGHMCSLHACTLEDNTFIGMGTTIIDKAYIEKNVMIGANSFVPQNKRLVSGFLYFGNPVKQIRPLTEQEIEHIQYSADHYIKISNNHKKSSILSEIH